MRYSVDLNKMSNGGADSQMNNRDLHHTAMDLENEPLQSARKGKKPRLQSAVSIDNKGQSKKEVVFETNQSSKTGNPVKAMRISNPHSSNNFINHSNSEVSVKMKLATQDIGKHVFYDAYGAQPSPDHDYASQITQVNPFRAQSATWREKDLI